jgi:hypothetical protein
MRLAILLFVFAALTFGQTTHKVTLAWTDTLNPAGTTYTIYRANGACSVTPTYVLIASAIVTKTYDDNNVSPGKYCYTATAVYNAEESVYADPAVAQVKPFKPTGLTVVVQ